MADPRLEIQFGADLREIKGALGALTRDLQGLRKTAESAGQRVGAGLDFAKRAAFQFGAAIGAAISLSNLATMSDEAAELTARLKLATRTTEEFNRAQQGTFDIAQRTRTSLKATAELYARIERSTRDLALNQATILQLTETINQAAQLSGGGTSAEAALFQLSQGLAAGELRGEELNSVLEQTPRIAQAIADGLDMPIGKLREYAKEGKLSAEAVLRALLNQKDVLAKEFAELPPTIAGGFTQIRNAMVQYLTTSKEAGTAARTVAEALKFLADNLAFVIDTSLRLGTAALALWAIPKVAGAVGVAFAAMSAAISRAALALAAQLEAVSARGSAAMLRLAAATEAAAARGSRAMVALRGAVALTAAAFAGWQLGSWMREQFLQVELFGIALAAGLHKIAVRIQHYFETAGTRIKLALAEAFNWVLDKSLAMNSAVTTVLSRLPGRIGKAYADAGAKARSALEGMRADTSGLAAEVAGMDKRLADSLAEVEAGYLALADAAIQARLDAAAAAVGGAGIDEPDPTGPASRYRADLELLRDSIDRALAELERLYEDGEIGLREYFRRKQELQTQAIDAAIAQARHELAVATEFEDQQKALVEIAKLQRDRAEIAPRIAREQAKAERELTRALEDVKDRLAELQGDTTASARRAIEREREELLRKFRDDPEAAQWIERLFNAETARTHLNAIRDEVQRTISDLRGTEDLLAAQVEAGQVMPHEAERQLQALREQSIAQLQTYREQLAALYETSGDPEVLRQLQAVDTEIARVAANMGRLRQQIADQAINSLTTFFTDLAARSKSAGEALRDFVLDFARGMAQIAAKALATYAVLQMLDAIYPGLGRATAAMSANVHHAGGVAGSGPTRRVDPLIFAAAPRFHSGGLPGLRPDEVPAILQRGEEVLSKGDPRNVLNGGGRTGPGTGTRVINVLDPSLVQDYMDSPAGEETVLNIIGRNPGRVKQVLA